MSNRVTQARAGKHFPVLTRSRYSGPTGRVLATRLPLLHTLPYLLSLLDRSFHLDGQSPRGVSSTFNTHASPETQLFNNIICHLFSKPLTLWNIVSSYIWIILYCRQKQLERKENNTHHLKQSSPLACVPSLLLVIQHSP